MIKRLTKIKVIGMFFNDPFELELQMSRFSWQGGDVWMSTEDVSDEAYVALLNEADKRGFLIRIYIASPAPLPNCT
jgi:hypothetical protein